MHHLFVSWWRFYRLNFCTVPTWHIKSSTVDGVLVVLMAFSIMATPRKVMMTMDNMIMNRFWSGSNGKIQVKRVRKTLFVEFLGAK
jgi:hypothetical protein